MPGVPMKLIPVAITLAATITTGVGSSYVNSRVMMAETSAQMRTQERRTGKLEESVEALRKRVDDHDRQLARIEKIMEDVKDIKADMKIVMRMQHDHAARTTR